MKNIALKSAAGVLGIASVAAILFLGTTNLYGDSGDKKYFSRPVTPDLPEKMHQNTTLSPAHTRPFSHQFMPTLEETLKGKDFWSKDPGSACKIQVWEPDSSTSYPIAKMEVRDDIDYKIIVVPVPHR